DGSRCLVVDVVDAAGLVAVGIGDLHAWLDLRRGGGGLAAGLTSGLRLRGARWAILGLQHSAERAFSGGSLTQCRLRRSLLSWLSSLVPSVLAQHVPGFLACTAPTAVG
ncbi:MAG TPA: hypothetical protein VGK33_22170, partial [Chloroflexota bacterium]